MELPAGIAKKISHLEDSEHELIAALNRVREEKARLVSLLGKLPGHQALPLGSLAPASAP